MADSVITALTSASVLTGAELFYTAQGGADRKVTAARLNEGGHLLDKIVSVKDPQFGATGDGSTDDTAAIQAAIDYACTHGIAAIYMPSGNYKTTSSIYLDPPDNIRASTATPKANLYAQFGLVLFGPPVGTSLETGGATIKPATFAFPAVIIGGGQGMSCKNIRASVSTGLQKAKRSTECIGFAVQGGGGGATRTCFHECVASGFHTGFLTGYAYDALADSNHLYRCWATDCYRGINISRAQNYINSLIDCTFAQCKYHVYSPVGKAVQIYGGNYSSYGLDYKILTIGSVSGLTTLATGPYNYSFTATVTNPSATTAQGVVVDTALDGGDLDVFCIKTTNWGLIPLVKTAYNPTTHVITLKFDDLWIGTNLISSDLTASSDIAADIAAATTLYAAELCVTFLGTGIHADGVHVENPLAVTQVFRFDSGFSSDPCSTLDNVLFDWQPSGEAYKDSITDTICLWYLQQCTPLVRFQFGYKSVFKNWSSETCTEPVILGTKAAGHLTVENWNLPQPVLWTAISDNAFTEYDLVPDSRQTGFGTWDRSPFYSSNMPSGVATQWRVNGPGKSAFMGFNHDYAATPVMLPAMVDGIINATVGAAGSYPPVLGSTTYRYAIPYSSTGTTPTALWAKAKHTGWSYGKDFSVTWSYRAGSNVVTVSDTSLFFSGLAILLNDGSSDVRYIVTGVYPVLGYITVTRAAQISTGVLSGTIGTTKTGTTIKQDAIVFTKF